MTRVKTLTLLCILVGIQQQDFLCLQYQFESDLYTYKTKERTINGATNFLCSKEIVINQCANMHMDDSLTVQLKNK